MPDEPEEQDPTQHTPLGEEIPIPSKEAVFRDLRKVAKPSRPNGGGSTEEQGEEHRPT